MEFAIGVVRTTKHEDGETQTHTNTAETLYKSNSQTHHPPPIANYFEKYLNQESPFADKQVLQSQHIPQQLVHRDEQIEQISAVLAPSLRLERPSNLFIYGKTGTGKTVCVRAITEQIESVAKKQGVPVSIHYINCKLKKVADTEYRLIAHLARGFNKAIPVTGLPTDEVYTILFDAIDDKKQIIIFVLDEIDHLVRKAGDELIYNLTRINTELKNAQVCIIGISNDLVFANNLDPRVKSSLSEEELIFPPYNALQLQTILQERSDKAFKPGVVQPGVVQKCAAYAAREHGDARRALELLRVAGELAEREQADKVKIQHLDHAEEKIERERYLDLVRNHPKQFQATLFAILTTNNTSTGDIYSRYVRVCDRTGLRPLTQRRVSDIIAELDMLGLITAKVISKGRFGRTREITTTLPTPILSEAKEILKTELEL